MFQALGKLEGCLSHRSDACQRLGCVGIKADVLEERVTGEPLFLRDTSQVRDHRATEVKRLSALPHNDLGRIGIEQRFESVLGMEWLDECGYFSGSIHEAILDGLNLPGVDERLIALHIDDNIIFHTQGLDLIVGFLDTIGAALVIS